MVTPLYFTTPNDIEELHFKRKKKTIPIPQISLLIGTRASSLFVQL